MRPLSILLPIVLLSTTAPAFAEEFPRFKVRQYEGWVEDTGTGQAKVKLVPYIVGPDTSLPAPPGSFNFGGENPVSVAGPPEITPDGRLKIPYRIVRDGTLPAFVNGTITAQTGIAADRLAAASKTFVTARYRTVTLKIGGEVFETRDLGGGTIVGGDTDAFYVPTDRYDLMNQLRAGDYSLELDYSFPTADFSSLKVDMAASAVSNAWVNAFREVVRSKSTSGGKFLFLDFSSEVSRAQVRESVRAGGSENLSTRINVELREPTPEQQARLEAVLGFAKLTQEQMMARHQAGYAAALAAANPKLADAHDKYLKELNTSTPDTSAQFIAALSKLQDADALSFMAAGFQMRFGDASSYYRYDGNFAANQTSDSKFQYTEYVIRNTLLSSRGLAYVDSAQLVGAAIQRAFDGVHMAMFYASPSQSLDAGQWAQGAARAIQDRNLARLRYAFDPAVADSGTLIDPNIALDANGNRLIHRAAATGDQAMVRLLLANGANPGQRNRLNDTALDVAKDQGHSALVALLQPEMGKRGTATLTLRHDGLSLQSLKFFAPAVIEQTLAAGATTSTVTIADYPMIMRTQAIAVFRRTVSPTEYPYLRFNYRPISQSPTGVLIEFPVTLQRAYRIRDGQNLSYAERVRFVNANSGYTFEPDVP